MAETSNDADETARKFRELLKYGPTVTRYLYAKSEKLANIDGSSIV
jgi:hypothetical protein